VKGGGQAVGDDLPDTWLVLVLGQKLERAGRLQRADASRQLRVCRVDACAAG
jgi:hypothetical protein